MKILLIFAIAGSIALMIVGEQRSSRTSAAPAEGCMFCHKKVSDPDPSHPVTVFGCHSCHLGNPYSMDKDRGHFTMVKNPGDLDVVDRTCGQTKCHPEIVARVKNSLMATNRGIIRSLEQRWDGVESLRSVENLLAETSADGIAIDQYRKMCGGCHLWKKRGDSADEVDRRGGGCSNCHVMEKGKRDPIVAADFEHTRMTTRIPPENCTKCHNRSGRIGLSYFGKFESEGYGTPYEGWELNQRTLSGERFYLDLPADVHHSKAGLSCIDCHTETEVMGDGKRHERIKDQLEVTCEACHSPSFSVVKDPESLPVKLAFLNKQIPGLIGAEIGVTKRGSLLYNLQKKEERTILYRKADGKQMDVPLSTAGAHHRLPGHERLSCQACHSNWMPQCYGCHIEYRKTGSQKDWLSGKDTPGQFQEFRSHIRFSKPTLGITPSGRVSPMSPCEVFVSVIPKEGVDEQDRSFNHLTLSAFDPHTTQKSARTCIDCHGDPKTLGFGEGNLFPDKTSWKFRPTYANGTGSGDVSFTHDTLVGKPVQTLTSESSRPFDREELERVLSVKTCLPCHQRYEDKIYRDFRESGRRFEKEEDLPCRQAVRR
ncbi:MAG: hypothetical protein C4576_34550 [Desulfobacteraceae bacterium]|nr:MAG: hypothetical protein C4576_34550 [Desulfobacteraceae bacterium]